MEKQGAVHLGFQNNRSHQQHLIDHFIFHLFPTELNSDLTIQTSLHFYLSLEGSAYFGLRAQVPTPTLVPEVNHPWLPLSLTCIHSVFQKMIVILVVCALHLYPFKLSLSHSLTWILYSFCPEPQPQDWTILKYSKVTIVFTAQHVG